MADFPRNPLEKDGYILEFNDDFDDIALDTEKWVPYYLPQWSSREQSRPRYTLADSALVLQIEANQPPWCPEFDGDVKVSSIQTGLFAGPVGSRIGQHQFKPNLVVREAQPTIRTYTPEARELLDDQLRNACRIVEPLGGQAIVEVFKGYPATITSAEATEVAFHALNGLLDEPNVFEAPRIMAGEDFSYMAQKAPGCFLRLGVRNPSWDRIYPVHTSTFRLDEDALPIGAASLAAAAIQWMQEKR